MAGLVTRQLVIVLLSLAILASGQSHARAGLGLLDWQFNNLAVFVVMDDNLPDFVINNDTVCPACPEERTAGAPCAYIACNLTAVLSLLPLVGPLRVDNENYLARSRVRPGIDGTLDPPPPRNS